jgi:hypothetical protein
LIAPVYHHIWNKLRHIFRLANCFFCISQA